MKWGTEYLSIRVHCIISSAFFTSAILFCNVNYSQDEIRNDKLINEITESLAKVLKTKTLKTVSCSVRIVFVNNATGMLNGKKVGTITKEDKYDILYCDDLKFGCLTMSNGTIRAVNPRYGFAISPGDKGETSSKVYSIQWLGDINNKEDKRLIEQGRKGAKSFLCSGWGVGGSKLLCDLTQDDITAARKISLKGKDYVEIQLKDIPQGKSDPDGKSDRYLIIDPEHSWVITESGYRLIGSNWNMIKKYEYQHDQSNKQNNHIPIPVQTDSRYLSDAGVERMSYTNYYEYRYIENVDKNQFYLTHYGLPEPKFESKAESLIKEIIHKGKIPNWMWYSILSIFCLGIAYWIKRRRAVA